MTAEIKAPLKVLITSAADKVPLVRAMQSAMRQIDLNGRVVAGDINDQALTAQVADDFWSMPPSQDNFLDEITSGLLDRQINMILPTRDGELLFWSKHAKYLEAEGIKVVISTPESVNICLDKLGFSLFGVENGFSFIPASSNLGDILSDSFVVKERFGSGSRSIGVNLSYDQAAAYASTLDQPIFQPYIYGKEFSVDAWVSSHHKVKGLVLRYRDKVVNGESQITRTFTNKEIESQVCEVIESLKLRGPVVLQAIQNSKGGMSIIECNARFGGASTAGIAAGVNSLYWSLLEAQGNNVDDYPFLRSAAEIIQVRVPSDIHIHDTNF